MATDKIIIYETQVAFQVIHLSGRVIPPGKINSAPGDMVRAMMAEGEFVEIFVDTPLAEAESRDVKGLYAKARAGELPNFTGIDSPYEPPEHPELWIDTTAMSAEEAADKIVEELLKRR
jgi:bifunctional enzyme CysN/CysC